jgi:hypothetical protein
MGEVDVPVVGRYIGTLGHVAEVAKIAVVDHLPVVALVYAVYLQGLRLVDQIKQGGEALTETDTATTAVAKIKHPLHLGEELLLVVIVRVFPIYRMSCGGIQVTFALSCRSCHFYDS